MYNIMQPILVFFVNYRVLVDHVDVYKNEVRSVTWHIPSVYTAQMSSKSKCVSLT